MIVLLILVILTGVGIYLANLWEPEWLVLTGILLAIIGGIALAVGLVSIPVERAADREGVAAHESLRIAWQASSDNLRDATLALRVAESDMELARAKVCRESWYSLWCAPEVENVEPIRGDGE